MKKKSHLFFALLLAVSVALTSVFTVTSLAYENMPLRATGLRTDFKQNPIGIDARKPRLSRQLQSSARELMPVSVCLPYGEVRGGGMTRNSIATVTSGSEE